MFDAVKVKCKKTGKGVRKSYKHINEVDMVKLGHYFLQDFTTQPISARKLQQCVLFYIIFFICHRGRENIYAMNLDTYKVFKDDNGKKYVQQSIDEMDKNHSADDYTLTNDGKMYENPGMKSNF